MSGFHGPLPSSESDSDAGSAPPPARFTRAQFRVAGVTALVALSAVLVCLSVFLHSRANGRPSGPEPTRYLVEPATTPLECDKATTAPSFDPQPKAECSFYKKKGDNCIKDWQGKACGSCFNPGSRAGVQCKGSKGTGYSCPPDPKDTDGDMAFACMDWTFGSTAMIAAEQNFNCRSGKPPVYFGVGTYGVDLGEDPMGGLGQCVLLHVSGVDRAIIAQSINTGHDVSINQFDLQMGAGGAGAFNTCAGDKHAMYPGGREVWGHQYGGLDKKSQCKDLPKYPRDSSAMKAAGDSLIGLCEYAWDKGVYSNPSIQTITRVPCPAELVNLTQFLRTDEPSEAATSRRLEEAKARRLEENHKCSLGVPGAGADYCMTRMMDCRKPSGAVKDNLQKVELLADGHRLIQPCTADGYTRIDVQCGCTDCYC